MLLIAFQIVCTLHYHIPKKGCKDAVSTFVGPTARRIKIKGIAANTHTHTHLPLTKDRTVICILPPVKCVTFLSIHSGVGKVREPLKTI